MADLQVSEDGYISSPLGQSSWANARGATTGTVTSNSANADVVIAFHTAGRGSSDFRVTRTFMYFDTSGINVTLADATLKLYGHTTTPSADIIVVKSTAFGGDGGTSLAAGDMDSFDDSTPYSSEFTSFASNTFNNISLNATALADIKNNDAFIICIMEHDHDFQNSAPSNTNKSAYWKNQNNSTTSLRPDLVWNGLVGYSHDVCGLAAANISKVNSLATAGVGKISGT
tara:strand:+ start:3072 stop:3758 length:687 start_codon:yes stop_codon:yes gene_type:complete